ncbi:MAG: endo-1,4-beta-xylanase [Rhizomicrobium sp.]
MALGVGAFSSAARAWAIGSTLGSGRTLASIAATTGRLYGCAAATGELSNAEFISVLKRETRILVAEYEMKRHTLQPHPDTYNFAPTDTLLRFTNDNGMAFRGHTLVWHKANPSWLQSALQSSRREAALIGYIQAVAGRYRGRMHSWDVVNEALAPGDGRSDNLRGTIWLRAFGPSYIAESFHAARATDPHALLVYNDWGCEAGGARNDRFRAATLAFLENAKARGIPIDAYGMQGHLQAFGTAIDQRKLRDFLDHLKAIGLRILVTEHDVDDSGGPSDVAVRDRAIADTSRRFLDVVLDNTATAAVITWGLSDRFVDPPGLKATLAGYRPRILPYDSAFNRKPLWFAMADSFSGARPVLNGGLTPDKPTPVKPSSVPEPLNSPTAF